MFYIDYWSVCVCVLFQEILKKKSFVTQDGYLDAGEVAHWILPGEVDHADNEAKHLIHETDTDKVSTASMNDCGKISMKSYQLLLFTNCNL